MTARRLPPPAGERGATIFVVLLVLTLLSAVGIFAVRAATQVTIAAGNNRQATQALLFAEGAGALAVAELGGPKATLYVDLTYTSADALNEQCQVNANLYRNKAALGAEYFPPPCYRLFSNEVAAHVAEAAGAAAVLYEPQEANSPGSFGPALGENADQLLGGTAVNAGREGHFLVELTDAYEGTPPAGFNVDDSSYRSVTLTLNVFSQVRSRPNAAFSALWCGSQASATTASLQAVRATVTLPMVLK